MLKKFIYSIIISTIFISACRKENPPPAHVVISGDTCVAGAGGSLDLAIIPRHHGSPIYGATTYMKFNTQSSPGALSNYDLMVVGEPAENHIHVNNMKCGNYFIYCQGYDSTISMIVRGGIPYSLPKSAQGNIDIYVPVTE